MLAKNCLNPADITVLHQQYTSADPPPVDLLRLPQFLDLLLDALFKPGSRIHDQHKQKYSFLLAYAVSVYETPIGRKGSARKSMNVNKDELKQTQTAIERVNAICTGKTGSNELLAELNTLYQCIKISPVVALGITQWVRHTVMEKNYFQLATEHTPVHLALLDEVTTCHHTLHQRVLDLLIHLFESPAEDLDVLVFMEVKKMLIDRMVHLLSKGCVMPVITYMKNCWTRQETDVSLIRYFVTEVLDVISPSYTSEFVKLFLPLVANPEVTGSMEDQKTGKQRTDSEALLVIAFLGE
jgi:negative elongation factor C/D